jgi:hypothetical protein
VTVFAESVRSDSSLGAQKRTKEGEKKIDFVGLVSKTLNLMVYGLCGSIWYRNANEN